MVYNIQSEIRLGRSFVVRVGEVTDTTRDTSIRIMCTEWICPDSGHINTDHVCRVDMPRVAHRFGRLYIKARKKTGLYEDGMWSFS